MMFLLPGRRLASCKALYPRTRRPLKMGAQSSWARGYYVEADAMRKITLALLLSTATCFPARADSSDSMRQGLFCSGLAAEIYAINSTEAAEKIADAGFEKCLCLWRKDARSTLTELKGNPNLGPSEAEMVALIRKEVASQLISTVLDTRIHNWPISSSEMRNLLSRVDGLVSSCEVGQRSRPE
jgi:hypothetical protein